MRWIFKLVNDQKNFTQSFEEENKRIESLSSLIEFHVDKTQLSEAEAISSIKLWYSNCDEENEGCPMCKHYNVKTIQLKWGVNRYSFIHVFINTTAIKQFEIEKTRNDCLQLMFSSISHEFRTPLNAFSNSLLLLESNYKILLQKIDKFVSIELIPKLISQNQRETDECFYKIWKISKKLNEFDRRYIRSCKNWSRNVCIEWSIIHSKNSSSRYWEYLSLSMHTERSCF